MGMIGRLLPVGKKFLVEGAKKLFGRGATEAAKGVAKEGFLSGLKSGIGRIAGIGIAGVGGITALNIMGSDGEGLGKIGDGIAATGEQLAGLAKFGKTVVGLGTDVAGGLSDVVESAKSGDFLGGLGNMVSGFLGKIEELVPEQFRGFVAPALLVGGAMAFGGTGIIGKVALAGVAMMALMGNAGGLKDAAETLIPGAGGLAGPEGATEMLAPSAGATAGIQAALEAGIGSASAAAASLPAPADEPQAASPSQEVALEA